jgi:hypothetical protein
MPALPLLVLAIALGIASGGWFRLARHLRLYSSGEEGGSIATARTGP